MGDYCTHCGAGLGLSAAAIAFSGHTDHPHDAGDLRRCVDYCVSHGIGADDLRKRMAGRSPEWDALTADWEFLTRLLAIETERGDRAPLTYAEMRRIIGQARANRSER
jgi:hypothetical protein